MSGPLAIAKPWAVKLERADKLVAEAEKLRQEEVRWLCAGCHMTLHKEPWLLEARRGT